MTNVLQAIRRLLLLGSVMAVIASTGVTAGCARHPDQAGPNRGAGRRVAGQKPVTDGQKAPGTARQNAPAAGPGAAGPGAGTGARPGAGTRPALPPTPRTVEDVIGPLSPVARARYGAACRRAGVAWPPKRVMLLAFKHERQLEVWGANAAGSYALLYRHRVLAASGGPGPKRREGDEQVPEGFYDITELNPNSQFHLSMRVGYPNADDLAHARVDRTAMGGDIYIHGNHLSIGCLAIGDPGIEELFGLMAQVPRGSRRIVIAPFDFRRHPNAAYPKEAAWVHEMYGRMKKFLAAFKR
ncbi:MAG TPA: L,D-transpeptidase family protein [Candidatus Kapabacteria bacterium]|nr:L,D-transpeptidase family protein [Candidatus Kapabacteria bacterium]